MAEEGLDEAEGEEPEANEPDGDQAEGQEPTSDDGGLAGETDDAEPEADESQEAASEHISSDLNFIDEASIRTEAVDDLLDRLLNAPVDASKALKDWVPDADEFQQKVISATDKTIRMLAPAGSGKTQTIISRALARIQDGMRPDRLLILTFDNAAAYSLREKLAGQLAQLGAGQTDPRLEKLAISTLNAYGYRLLNERFPQERKEVNQGRSHRFIRDSLNLLQAASPERHAALAGNLRTRVYLDFIALLKNELFDPREFNPQGIAEFILASRQTEPFFADTRKPDLIKLVVQSLVWLFQKYEQKLQANNLMDFDDQKLRPYRLLQEHEYVARVVQGSFDEVIVDEFQDINRLDFELIKLIASEAVLTVTGDDDQAIYGFRGCSPEYIINLEDHLGRAVASYELQVNYRCPPNIVRLADQLIRHNRNRVGKNPIAARDDSAVVKVVATQTAGLEARGTVEFIRRVMRAQPALNYSDFAILYRTNAQSLPLQVELILNDVPYFVRPQDNIVSNDSLNRLLAVLRVKTAMPSGREPALDDQVLAVASYFRWWSPSQESATRRVMRDLGAFSSAIRSTELVEAIPKAGGRMADAFDALGAARSLQATLEVVADRFRGVRGMVGSLEEALDQRVPLGEVFELAAHFGGSLPEFISTMERALERARSTNAGKDEDGVALLTYFKSKGRQWHTVILTTCNEGLIPHSRSPVEDERRLFYVAMTRASANLMISYLKNSVGKSVAPSRFLLEAGLL